MAQKVQVLLLCDLEDGNAEAEETIQFGLGNTQYEIDVCGRHAQEIRASLEPFVAHARKAGTPAGGGRRRRDRSAANREQSADIRSWAKDRGIQVSERGRIPASVVKEYEQAH
jgi:Lsr2